MSDGEYYCSIGDDDIVLPSIIDLAKWMKKNNVDIARTSRVTYYQWPVNDGMTAQNPREKGFLAMGPYTAQYRVFNPLDGVIDVLKHGCQTYLSTDMGGSYHALVSMSLMNKAYSVTGYYYSGFSPDIYNATILSLVDSSKAIYVDFPISIPGICPESASYRALNKCAVSSVEDAIQTYGKQGYIWDSRVPYYFMPQTTWAVSMLNAIDDMGRQDLITKYFNREYLVNSCLNYQNGKHRENVMKMLKEDEISLINPSIQTENSISILGEYRRKAAVLFNYMTNKQRRYYGVKDIGTATDHMISFLGSAYHKKKWSQFLKIEL